MNMPYSGSASNQQGMKENASYLIAEIEKQLETIRESLQILGNEDLRLDWGHIGYLGTVNDRLSEVEEMTTPIFYAD